MRHQLRIVFLRVGYMALGANVLALLVGGGDLANGMASAILVTALMMLEILLYEQRPGVHCYRCGKWLFAIQVRAVCNACRGHDDYAPQHLNGNSMRNCS